MRDLLFCSSEIWRILKDKLFSSLPTVLHSQVDLAGLSKRFREVLSCSNFNLVLWFIARSQPGYPARLSLNSGVARRESFNCPQLFWSFCSICQRICGLVLCDSDYFFSACTPYCELLRVIFFPWTFSNDSSIGFPAIRTKSQLKRTKNEIFKLFFNCYVCTSASYN